MRIGIDLGGSKIEGLVLGKDGSELARRRVETPRKGDGGDYDATVAAVAALVAAIAGDAGAGIEVPVGVGIPGSVSPRTGLVRNANSTCLIGHALDKDLAAAMGRAVRLANDADCFAVSEATDGAGRGAGVVFGAILGTGVGGGLCVGGRLVRGPNAIAGEWGHNPLPWPQALDGAPPGDEGDAQNDESPGPECYCGKRGCIETFVSGPGLERDFAAAAGRKLTAEEIVELAGLEGGGRHGTPRGEDGTKRRSREGPDRELISEATKSLKRYEHRLARALAGVINVLDPDVIVLGGGMSNAARLYDTVPKLWGEWVFSDTVETRLAPAEHGDSSGVRGAAWLWEG